MYYKFRIRRVIVFTGISVYLMMSYMQVSYVLDTEDFLFRLRKRRRLSPGGIVPDKLQTSKKYAAKVQRFHLFLSKP